MLTGVLSTLAGTGIAVYVWGRFLTPRRQQWSCDILIEAPVERVWSVMTDFVRQVDWRTDLRSVETGVGPFGEEQWRERPLLGPANWFRVTRRWRARVIEVERLPNGFCSGSWSATLESAARSTRVTLSETLFVERPLARPFARLWLHGGANPRVYTRDLKQYLESHPL